MKDEKGCYHRRIMSGSLMAVLPDRSTFQGPPTYEGRGDGGIARLQLQELLNRT